MQQTIKWILIFCLSQALTLEAATTVSVFFYNFEVPSRFCSNDFNLSSLEVTYRDPQTINDTIYTRRPFEASDNSTCFGGFSIGVDSILNRPNPVTDVQSSPWTGALQLDMTLMYQSTLFTFAMNVTITLGSGLDYIERRQYRSTNSSNGNETMTLDLSFEVHTSGFDLLSNKTIKIAAAVFSFVIIVLVVIIGVILCKLCCVKRISLKTNLEHVKRIPLKTNLKRMCASLARKKLLAKEGRGFEDSAKSGRVLLEAETEKCVLEYEEKDIIVLDDSAQGRGEVVISLDLADRSEVGTGDDGVDREDGKEIEVVYTSVTIEKSEPSTKRQAEDVTEAKMISKSEIVKTTSPSASNQISEGLKRSEVTVEVVSSPMESGNSENPDATTPQTGTLPISKIIKKLESSSKIADAKALQAKRASREVTPIFMDELVSKDQEEKSLNEQASKGGGNRDKATRTLPVKKLVSQIELSSQPDTMSSTSSITNPEAVQNQPRAHKPPPKKPPPFKRSPKDTTASSSVFRRFQASLQKKMQRRISAVDESEENTALGSASSPKQGAGKDTLQSSTKLDTVEETVDGYVHVSVPITSKKTEPQKPSNKMNDYGTNNPEASKDGMLLQRNAGYGLLEFQDHDNISMQPNVVYELQKNGEGSKEGKNTVLTNPSVTRKKVCKDESQDCDYDYVFNIK